MNIQLPVLLWTVICFLVLMLVLRNLLFRPIFRILDQRKEKIAAAARKKEEIAALEKEHEEKLALLEEDAKIQRENYIKSELKLIKIKNRQDLEDAKSGRAARLAETRKNTAEAKEEIRKAFSSSSEIFYGNTIRNHKLSYSCGNSRFSGKKNRKENFRHKT